jgi:hypothetical protein
MVNETAPLLGENPFWTLYKKQFGNLPAMAETSAKQKRSPKK